ncbi:MAG: GNAT family N-acetyltransferase [Desulfarculus sp.]|nr:GNAT family N-acetyltransferase [Desulfarculus sp.]
MGRTAVSLHVRGRAVQDDLALHCQAPGQLPPGRLDQIEALVRAGQAVGTQYVRHNLERAHLIAYALEGGRVVATVTLKNPRPEYVQRLRRRTGLDLSGYLERGYTSVHSGFSGRGLGTRLVRHLTEEAPGRQIYVVIAMHNLAAQAISIRCGTQLVARFFSRATGQEYGVWIQGPLPEQA